MDLKLLAKQITDSVIQRSRNAAVNLLVSYGMKEADARSFINELMRRIPLMKDDLRKYIQGVVRWCIQGDIDPSDDRDLSKVNSLLAVIRNSPCYDFYDKDFNGASFKEVQSTLNVKLDGESERPVRQGDYKVIPIESYREALKYKKYAPDWCILESEQAFDEHTFNGVNKFFFCLKDGWKDEEPIPGDNYPYDNYGYSMIAVSVDPDGNVVSTTSRWNFDDAHDNFLTESQLKKVLGNAFLDLYL